MPWRRGPRAYCLQRFPRPPSWIWGRDWKEKGENKKEEKAERGKGSKGGGSGGKREGGRRESISRILLSRPWQLSSAQVSVPCSVIVLLRRTSHAHGYFDL